MMNSEVEAAPLIFVLIPSYNHGPFLAQRIRSVLEQSFSNLVVRIIDDCSTDQTETVVESFADERLTFRRRSVNSGSPFTAWREILEDPQFQASHYVWIAESDDFSDTCFLERALAAFSDAPDAALYYCHSWKVDPKGLIVGHTLSYLNEQFPAHDWNSSFDMSGQDYVDDILLWGNAVPNMSSAVIRTDAFRQAVSGSDFGRFRLAADWLFVARVARQGRVAFDSFSANFFRTHQRTARQETKVERTVFEYFIAIFNIGKLSRSRDELLMNSLRRVAIMFFHQKGSILKFLNIAIATDAAASVNLFLYFSFRILRKPRLTLDVARYAIRRRLRAA